jgi:1-acyl-sn-glycerol-3-phosphate acyltransferase
MIYSILRFLVRIAVRVFFKSIHITNKENIPASGPLIIVANHPSTFMDPLVIATIVKREIFFLAKGEAFKSGFAKFLLPKLNMIPVYRKQDDATELHKNDQTFEKCYEHLEKNGVILIFPEGTSITERKLREIKTGAARIALGAEAKNSFTLGVKILHVGLNYSDPQAFKSDLFVKIDKPTDVRDFADEYQRDTKNASVLLTETIRTRLEEHIINTDNNYLDELLGNIESLYKIKIAKELGYSLKEKEEDFVLTKNISERLHYFYNKDRARVNQLDEKVKRYLSSLDKLGISDEVIRKNNKQSFLTSNLLSIVYIVLGFPLFVYGWINNYIPYRIPGLVANKVSKEKEYHGPIAMVTGIFTFLIFYSFQTYFVQTWFRNFGISFIYLLSLPISGYFAYSYYYSVKAIKGRWVFISLFYSRNTMMANLILQREIIIKDLDAAKVEYNNFLEASA